MLDLNAFNTECQILDSQLFAQKMSDNFMENSSAEALIHLKQNYAVKYNQGNTSSSDQGSPSASPSRPQRNRKRNKLIFYGDEDVPQTPESKTRSPAKIQRTTTPIISHKHTPQKKRNAGLGQSPIKTPLKIKLNLNDSFNSLHSQSPTHGTDKSQAKRIGIRLRNLLKLPKAHKMCIYEWFYSHIDKPLFQGDNDFCMCLKESFPELYTRKLTRAHWAKIRRIMGKPRRCSEAFFIEERNALKAKRQKIRMLQQNKFAHDDIDYSDLPKEIPMPLVVGTRVTARLRGAQDGLCTGTIDAIDIANGSYRVTFDRQNLGTCHVRDIEVASCEPQETMQLASLMERKRPPRNLFSSPPQLDFNNSLQSPANEHDPVLGQSPQRSKLPGSESGTLGGFPIEFLVQVTRLSKILTIKKEKIGILRKLNSEAERADSYGEELTLEFQRKYATYVIDLERLNRDLNSLLVGVQKYCLQLSPNHTLPGDHSSRQRQQCIYESEQMVENKNLTDASQLAVKNTGLTDLVVQLTALMLQIKHLRESNASSFEFKSINDSLDSIKQRLSPENLEAFQNNVEIHVAHIQSGMINTTKSFYDI